MDVERIGKKQDPRLDITSVATLIARTQRDTGEIPWSETQKTDPWDHIEAAMGLSVGGYLEEAQRAFQWMKQMQLPDGSWYSSYMNGEPEDRTRETNLSSYIAVGVFHYYLITRDMEFLADMWPTVQRAIDFVLGMQAPEGEIYWAVSPEGRLDPMALLTGSSSIYMSIKCALNMAELLGRKMPEWNRGLEKLEAAIQTRPHLFNVTKSRFSMDWFYPILCGAITGEKAQQRIDKYWKKFVVEGHGARCVSDEPWVTIAETSELVLALVAHGNQSLAEIVFGWISDKRYDDGSLWCGYTFPDMTIWPEEKISWTNGVYLMAADALYDLTPAGQLFSHSLWEKTDTFAFRFPGASAAGR